MSAARQPCAQHEADRHGYTRALRWRAAALRSLGTGGRSQKASDRVCVKRPCGASTTPSIPGTASNCSAPIRARR